MVRFRVVAVCAAALLTGCSGSTHPRQTKSAAASTPGARTIPSATEDRADDLCRFLTPDVIALASFDVPVSKVTDASGRFGTRLCVYGDNPNPAEVSLSGLTLGEEPPAALESQHVSARQEARRLADMCVHDSLVQLGPSGGIGSFAAFCIGTPGSVRGGWVQNGDVFFMSYFTPSEAKRSTPDRLAHYAEIASAISREIG